VRLKDKKTVNYSDIFFGNIGEINLDQTNVLLIEKVGTVVTYKMDGAIVRTLDLATEEAEGEDRAYIL